MKNKTFSAGYKQKSRSLLFNDLTECLNKYGDLDAYGKKHVLSLVKYKVLEGNE